MVSGALERDEGLQVVGTARDGLEAVEKVRELRPDVVTLDVEMPRLDGNGALQQIMAGHPCPVVMVSSLTQRGAEATIRALSLGAVDFVPKPSGSISLDLYKVQDELVQKVKAAARVQVGRLGRWVAPAPAQTPMPVAGLRSVPTAAGSRPGADSAATRRRGRLLSRLVVVAASTGGPGALHRLLSPLPGHLRAGLLVVQHMPPGFTRSLAAHLDQASGLEIREAEAGDRPVDGVALVAPGGRHMVFGADGTLQLSDTPARHGVRPAADVTLESIPESQARGALVIVLTGMGMDGARGARYLKNCGAEVWSQDEASSVVYGMPRAVAELGVADRIGTPEQFASWLIERAGG